MTRLSLRHRIENVLAQGVLRGAMLVPYPARVRGVGWMVTHLLAPVNGWRRRIRENLATALPDLPAAEVERIVRRVPDNVGRALIEIYSGPEFLARAAAAELTGPGAEALRGARAAGRPVVLVTAHLGNYDAVRGTLAGRGYPMAALYKPMRNPAFNDHYVRAVEAIAGPVFPTDARGIAGLVRHLRDGGIIGIVGDVAATSGPLLRFFGQPAHTALSAAEWALKYDAAMIPVFGLRQPDGLSFRLFAAAPVSRGTAEEMMQSYNDTVEAVARDHLDQWFWLHRRWKQSRSALAG